MFQNVLIMQYSEYADLLFVLNTCFTQELYTTNPTERSTAAIERSTNQSSLEWSVESHRALAEQWPSKSVEHSAF